MRTASLRTGALGLLLAAAAAPSPAAETWSVDAGTLGVLVEDHRAPIVEVRIEWPVGRWSPWFREHHAAEAFEIQMHDKQGALRRRADLLAADIALEAGDRFVALSVTCLAQDLGATLGLVRDVLANREFDQGELKLRAQTRRIAWEGSLKNPEFRIEQASAQALLREGDPRRIPWDGPEQISLDAEALAATRDRLVRLPGRIVGLAGDVTPEAARAAATSLLPAPSDAPPAGLAPDLQPLVEPARRAAETDLELARLTQVYFAYGRDSLPWGDADYPAFLLANHVLAGHFYSRLYVALRHEGGETYGAGSRSQGDVVPGPYALATFTRTANAKHTEEKLREVLRVFHEKGLDAEELADATGYLRGRLHFRRQSPAQRLERWMLERRLGLAEGFLDALPERAAALSLDEVNAFVRRWYDPRRFAMIRLAAE